MIKVNEKKVASLKAGKIRSCRDALLTECDWTMMPDAPTDKAAWAAYRQALRDISSQPGFPLSVVMPQKPE